MGNDIESTWATRDLKILVAAYRRFEAGERAVLSQLEGIREELDLTVQQLVAGVEALAGADPPYIEIEIAGGWRDDRAGTGYITGISERARRDLGAWPSANGLVEQLVAALSQAAEDESEPDRKSRLQAAAATLGGMARDIAVSVIAARLGRVD